MDNVHNSLEKDSRELQSPVKNQTPVVTINETETWARRKGEEIVHFLQKFV